MAYLAKSGVQFMGEVAPSGLSDLEVGVCMQKRCPPWSMGSKERGELLITGRKMGRSIQAGRQHKVQNLNLGSCSSVQIFL